MSRTIATSCDRCWRAGPKHTEPRTSTPEPRAQNRRTENRYDLDGVINIRQLYQEFPQRFWIVVGVHFIITIGEMIVMPRFVMSPVRPERAALAMEAEHG